MPPSVQTIPQRIQRLQGRIETTEYLVRARIEIDVRRIGSGFLDRRDAPDAFLDGFHNRLLVGIERVASRVLRYKEAARQFYYDVALCIWRRPACGGRLRMTGTAECVCEGCAAVLDPTVEFQKSACCGADLVRRVFHYACANRGRTTPSRFLFDERLFTPEYFTEKMRESRQRKRQRREELKRLLASSRSDTLALTELPAFDAIGGFEADLDSFVGSVDLQSAAEFLGVEEFNMSRYRAVIWEEIQDGGQLFSAFPRIGEGKGLPCGRWF